VILTATQEPTALISPPVPAAGVQAALVAALLEAEGAGIWMGSGPLELVWSEGLSPRGVPPNRFQEFLKRCLARAAAKPAPFMATDKLGDEEFAFVFIPFGSPFAGVAVFSGSRLLWEKFHASRAKISTALNLAVAGETRFPRRIDIPLLRSRSVAGTAAICADHLCGILGAARVSILSLSSKKPRLLACSGASSIDRHSPEVSSILSKFTLLEDSEHDPALLGGCLSKWCKEPEAASFGILVEKPAKPAEFDSVLSAESGLIAHAIESKRHPVASYLFPATSEGAALKKKNTAIRAALALFAVILLTLLIFPVPRTISGSCELVPSRRAPVVAQTSGRIQRVFAQEGMAVAKGTPLFQIDDSTLRSHLTVAEQQFAKADAEVRLHREEGDMQTLRAATLEKQRLESEIGTIRRDITESTIASPLDGAVVSKDLDLRLGEVVQPGIVLCEVASLENWDLQIRIPESEAGPLELAIEKRGELPVRYALQARADSTLQAKVSSRAEISQMVYTESSGSFVYVTLRGIDLPSELRAEIRPGFSGYAKIEGRQLPLAFNLVERAFHFLRLHFLL
jgi:biotin carboxyl carrier protein